MANREAIDLLNLPTRTTFAELMIALHARRHTGAVTFHFFSGTATSVELTPDPVQIRLDRAPRDPLPLDTPARVT